MLDDKFLTQPFRNEFANNKCYITQVIKFVKGNIFSFFYNVIVSFPCSSHKSRIGPAWVAPWWACWTHDLGVVSAIPGWRELSFRHFFAATSAEACEKSCQWLSKVSCVSKYFKVALNPKTNNNQPKTELSCKWIINYLITEFVRRSRSQWH